MRASVEDINPVKKKLSVIVDSEEVDHKLNESYKELKKKANVPGFRKGKVPREILERRFGHQVEEDVVRKLINETLPKALDEVQSYPLGSPVLERDSLEEGRDFSYSAIMEVRPEFEVENYKGIELNREAISVTDEDVDKHLEQIRESHGKLRAVEDERPIRQGDYVVLDYEGFEGDQPLEGMKSSNFLLKVGSGDFHPQFETALAGHGVGDETEISVDFEEGYHHSTLAGRTVNFKVKVNDIKEMELPELNDEFVQSLGEEFNTLKDVRYRIRESLTAREKQRIDREMKDTLLQKIGEGIDIELPQSLVESELRQAVERIRQNLQRSGSSLEKAGLSVERLREDLAPSAQRRVKETLILARIAEQEDISVDEQDVADGFERLAESTGQDAAALRRYYEANDLMDSFKSSLLEEKTLNYLMEHANIISKSEENQEPQNR